MTSPAEIAALLLRCPVFARTEGERLQRLAASATLERFAAGAAIFAAGDAAQALYVLLEGVVRVFHRHAGGLEVTVKHLSPVTTFGEMEILTGERFLESTAALRETTVVKLPAPAFLAHMEGESPAALTLLRDVCARFCVAARNERAVFFDVPVRLASLVLSYAELFGKPSDDGGVRIGLELTQDDLARGLGVVVRSVARTLAQWKELGWVSRRKGWLVVHRPEALRELCRELHMNLNYRFEPDLAGE